MPDTSHDLIYRILVEAVGQEKAAAITAEIERQSTAVTKLGEAGGAAATGLQFTAAELAAINKEFGPFVAGIAKATGSLEALQAKQIEAAAVVTPLITAQRALTQTYIIQSAAEYEAIAAASESLTLLIAKRAAAGKSVGSETIALANLNAALQTTSAQRYAAAAAAQEEAEIISAANTKIFKSEMVSAAAVQKYQAEMAAFASRAAEAAQAEAAALSEAEAALDKHAAASAKLTAAYQAQQAKQAEIIATTQLQIDLNSALAAGDAVQVASIQNKITVRKEALALITKGIPETEAYALATKSVAAAEAADAAETARAAAAKAAKTGATVAGIGATEADTVATEANTAAAANSAFAGRKLVSLFDELSRGQRGAMVGTLGSFLKNMGAGLPAMIAMLAVFAGGNIIWEYFRKGSEGGKQLAESINHIAELQAQLTTRVWEDQQKAIDDVRESNDEYNATLAKTASEQTQLEQAEQNDLKILEAQQEAREEILKAMEKAELLAAGGDQVKEAQVRSKYGDVATQDQFDYQRQQIVIKESYLAAETLQRDKAKSAADAAHAATIAEKSKKPDADLAKAESDALRRTGAKSIGELRNRLADAQKEAAPYGDQPSEITDQGGVRHETIAGVARMQAELLADALKRYDEAFQAVQDHAEKLRMLESHERELTQEFESLKTAVQNASSAVHTEESVYSINLSAAAKAQEIGQKSTFATAVGAELAPPGTKLTDQQQAAETEMTKLFDSLGGNFQVWIQHLRGFHGDVAAWKKEIEDELVAMQRTMHQTASRSRSQLTQ